jgi:hypothetical protein
MSIKSGQADIISTEFDSNFYVDEYPDLAGAAGDPFGHFRQVGWFEGRNPNPYFDTTSYLLLNKDVDLAGINPFVHYLRHGRRERRQASPGVSPSTRALLLLGYPLQNWVEALRPEVDVSYYRLQVGRHAVEDYDPAAHFAFRGWREGLNAAPGRRIESLKLLHPQAVTLLVNPLLAQLELEADRYRPQPKPEMQEAEAEVFPAPSAPEPEFMPPPAAEGALPERDKALVATEFDRDYYLATYPDIAAADVDPFEHYYYTGWREGRNPSPEFDGSWYLTTYPDVTALEIDPFWHWLLAGRAEGRLPRNPGGSEPQPRTDDAEPMALIRTEFNEGYYLFQNADVAAAGIDPVEHYYYSGWREGRNPTKDFDTRYYLEANEDVKAASLNPFWHYLVAGRKEGRAGCRPGGYRRRIIEAARTPEERSKDYKTAPGKLLTRRALASKVDAALKRAAGVVVSLSHDCYIRVIGGTQIFIADERQRFAERKYAYIHLSPRRGRLNLAPLDPKFEVQIVIDGAFAGFATMEAFTSSMKEREGTFRQPRFLVVHSILGFNEEQVLGLHAAFGQARTVLWLHDYTTLCEGFNLLRNDLAFCNAPPPNSKACRVCIYGPTRMQHLERMRKLFEACNFEVLSPSEFTLDLWSSRTQLPHASAAAHPHWLLESLTPEDSARPTRAAITTQVSPASRKRKAPEPAIRIGFVGFPSSGKGWQIFSALVDEHHADPRYQFVHFAARNVSSMPECEFVVTETTPEDRDATARLLHEHRIDFVAMLSPWPETFSFVAHEAVAAGCRLLCLKDSGNVAAMVRRTGLGIVFDDGAALVHFFKGEQAMAAAREARAHPQRFRTINAGTTATVTQFFEAIGSK